MEKPTVLLIDSDPNFSKTLAGLLLAGGYATLAASSGAEGLALLGTRTTALALIDLGLPDIPGLDLLSAITAEHPATKAIILTGNATLESAIEATSRGALAFLVKPCETERLMREIRRAIEKQRAEEGLRRSESLFRGLLESAPEAILIVDDRYRIQMVNRQFEAMFGYDRTEVVGRELEMLIPRRYVGHRDLSRGYIRDPNVRYIGEGGESYALKKDGSEMPVEIGLSPHTTPEGICVFATIRDISERKRAKAAHRQHIYFLESMELINQAIRQETDVELMLQNVVKTVLPMFGCDRVWLFYPCDPDAPSFRVPVETSRPEYPGANTLNLEVPMAPSVAHDLREALASEDPLTYTLGQDKSVNDLSAKQFTVQSQMFQAIYPKMGKPWVFGMHQCSYPRLWTDEEKVLFKEIGRRVADGLSSVLFLRDLRESEERFRALVNQAADAIFLHDADGVLLDVNGRACDSLGFTREELLTMSVRDIDMQLIDDDRIKSLWRTLHPARPITVEGTHKRKDGTTFPVEVRLGTLQLKDRQAILALARDITERMRLTEELRAQREQRHLHARLLQAQKLESVGHLAAGIAHELNTPAQFIATNIHFIDQLFSESCQVLASLLELHRSVKEGKVTEAQMQTIEEQVTLFDWDYLKEEIPKAISQSQEGIERITSIVRAMKEFSHPGGKKKTASDLNRIVETTITVSRNEWKYVATVTTDLDPGLQPVPCLANEVGQALLNLLINAAHAIKKKLGKSVEGDKGKITISTRQQEQYVEIRIADTGCGIPGEIRDKVFEPFFTTRDVGKGTGLGLAIAYDVVTGKHGGTLTFESEPGGGTTFIIRLPRSKIGEVKESHTDVGATTPAARGEA